MSPADTLRDTIMGPPSPSKGKGVDTGAKTWRTGWWDFYPLLERPKRPLQWSSSSVIFSAHATEALVTGRHFSSSKQFSLPSPTPIVASPSSYDPPTTITVSPSEKWLFAYFPRRDGEGIGCIWQRGHQIDTWVIKENWNYPRNGGVVAASWIGHHREWASMSGTPTRLPSRGPHIPVSDLTFMMITADNYVHIVCNRQYKQDLVFLKRSMTINGMSYEPLSMIVGDNFQPLRQCIDAALGLGYTDLPAPILVATRSRRMPPPPPRSSVAAPPFNSMDLSIPINLSMSNSAPDQKAVQWDDYREEPTINVFDIRLGFDGFAMSLKVTYQCSIEAPDPLIDMKFICMPHPCESSPPLPVKPECPVFLAISTLQLDDYARPPTSTLSLYSASYYSNPNDPQQYIWEMNKYATRTFEHDVLIHWEPFLSSSGPAQTTSLYATVLHHSGTFAASSAKSGPSNKPTTIGVINVLNLPDLTNRTDYDPAPIMCPSDIAGRDLPINAVCSPNKRLISLHSSPLGGGRVGLQSLPRTSSPDTNTRDSLALSVAILGRISTADILHRLCSRKLPLSQAVDTLYQTIELLETRSFPVPNYATWTMIGIAVDVYRARSLLSKDEKEKVVLNERWQTGHDICSIAGCNIALEDCKEDSGYDYEAAWEIISMCTWLVQFAEKLLRACVVWSSAVNDTSSDMTIAPIFLHLTHPYALQNLCVALKHVHRFKLFIKSLPAGEVNTRLAQTILVDSLDQSGIDFEGLIALLESSLEAVKKTETVAYRRALASCQPQPAMQPHLAQLLEKISESQTIINKSTLFLKPSDLINGLGRISLTKVKGDEKDVVTKAALLKDDAKELCLRCGGKSTIIKRLERGISPKWRVWEQMWQLRCICGGSWVTTVQN
ncbi:hypothetical protein D9619_005436 [Psilocybe cf. subviscida]|uniref:Mediator complex subunit 16 C-terminal domain-containing protein n=1 Tax=Psilocybe cf. subviscida TaxID=2480587 RepID=A0A8H5BYM4_9AGAR|nr:hypothetical protein D9619_005436 [Psilocybe cf. subviscida]